MRMLAATGRSAVVGLLWVCVGAAAEAAPWWPECPADCDGDGRVAVTEIVRAVRVALGRAEPAECSHADVDAGGAVSLSELIAGVRAALDGCAVAVAEVTSGHCLDCHDGIEDAHPARPLGCTQCHGGDPRAATREGAHVAVLAPIPTDARVLPLDYPDRDGLCFLNPTNLRIVDWTCGRAGGCHAAFVEDVRKSMMATTAGHLAGGGYQSGILPDKTAQWANFAVRDSDGDTPVERGALPALEQIPPPDLFAQLPLDAYQRHYADVPRKLCMRCHLWSRGSAVRGVPGQEGSYRSEGCAACHMPYTNAALSESADPTIDKSEVGHPRLHQITRRIPSEQCAHCHYRGARIGLSFRGLAQLPPGTPAGPGYAGISPERIHGAWHVQNPDVNPPDIHHERGMHCIDCHVRREIMGDGNLYSHMDQATEIECESCHGTPDRPATLVTQRGLRVPNLREENGRVVLVSKVTGREHEVPQVRDAVDPASPRYNPLAAAAMDSRHLRDEGGLECYACHSAWQPNCYGCHFSRDLGDSAMDLLAGEWTPGRPSTATKVFVNFKNFIMGYNGEGKIAPYITGCQVLATVTDEEGNEVLWQEMPVTAAGLSGLALNPSHPHTNRRTARSCVECHRNPAALGLGTNSFFLTRRYLFALGDRDGGELTVIDRRDPPAASVVARLPVPGAVDLAVRTDPVTGRATVAYVATGDALVAVDVTDPTAPAPVAAVDLPGARGVAFGGSTVFVAAGSHGVHVLDAADPLRPVPVASVTTRDARALVVHGFHLLVADGAGGLAVVDAASPARPRLLGRLDFDGSPDTGEARDVISMPVYFDPPAAGLKPFRMVAFVADGAAGVRVVDLRDPESPRLLATVGAGDARAVFAKAHYDVGSEEEPSLERSYLFVAAGSAGLEVFDVSNPSHPAPVGTWPELAPLADLFVANAFEPPLNRDYLYGATGTEVIIADLSDVRAPRIVRRLPVPVTRGLDLERVALDRMVDEDGRPIKDNSHLGARPFRRQEMLRILSARL